MPTMGWEHAQEIAQRFDLRPEDVKWALDDIIRHLEDYPDNQGRKYTELLPQAAALVRRWLESSDRWAVDVLDPTDVAEFVRGRAPGCTWAVIQAKIKSLTPDDKIEAGFRLIREWVVARPQRGTAMADLHRRIDEMEADDG